MNPDPLSRAEACAAAAERRADEAEARVDQLTDQLALTRDTLTHRTRALNETGTTNDTLRATLSAITTAALALVKAEDDSVSYEPCAACLRAGVALLDGESYAATDAALETLRAALDGLEPNA